MPEKINLSHRDTSAMFFVIEALTLAADKASADKVKGDNDNNVTVQLLVNGVEVPFEKTIEDYFNRVHAHVDEVAAKIVLDKFSEYSKIADMIERHKWEFESTVEKVFRIKLGEDR